MKNKLAILALALASAFSLSAWSQTADDGTGPTEQPSSPMEAGPGPNMQGPDQSYGQPSDAQPTEAQPGGPTGEAPATSDQGVARLSLIHGDVSTQRGDSGDWSAATLNQPVMGGDKVSTGNGGRTELQLDFANILRLSSNSQANIANLTKKNILIQLGQGMLNYTVSKDSEAEPEIDTPNVSVHPAHHDGVFRVEVQPDGDTIVIVRKGEAQIATPQGSTEVRAGEMATVRGTGDQAQYKIGDAPDRDDWDRWNSDRDHMIQNAQSWHHTNKYYTGAEDLDAYGSWRNVPDYGDVWVPNEPDGWVPYRDGNWVYEPYYGWTWVGYEPWGWAPYHYGRWFWYGSSWAWWPGPVWGGGFYRPFWAPAYVSFWGWGGGWGFGFGYGGWGGFGWLPIGPCDWFHPWWGGYGGRFGVVNVTNIHITNINNYGGIAPLHGGNRFSNVANIHDNHVFRAMSTVNAGHFGGGRVSAMPVTRTQLSGARLMAGNLPVVPSHASLSASGRAAAPSTIRNTGSQKFFGAHNNIARPASFQQVQSNLRQTMAQNRVGSIPAGGHSAFASQSRGFGNNSAAGKTNAGTFGSREMNNRTANSSAPMQNGNRGGFNNAGNTQRTMSSPTTGRTAAPVNNGGYRPFTPPNSGRGTNPGTPSMGNEAGRGTTQAPHSNPSSGGFRPFTPPSSSNRPLNMGSASGQVQRGNVESSRAPSYSGFRPFTPPSSSQMSRGGQSSAVPERSSGSYWNRTMPSSGSLRNTPSPNYGSYNSRGYESYGSGRSASPSSRPQLDMRQPIVRQPSYGGNPSYRSPRSTPSYGGSRSAAPSYGGGGHYSAPSGGGGHYSAPSGGGHSAPSGGSRSSGGGGGHSSGGGSHGGHR